MRIEKLVPWRRAQPAPTLWDDSLFGMRGVDDLFRAFFGALDRPAEGAGRMDAPSVDLSETEDAVVLEAELPGVAEEDVDVELGDGVVMISGQKRTESEDKGKSWHRVERSWGSFRRTLPLPCDVEADKAEATFERGVLTVRLPKSVEAKEKVRKIEVRSRS